MWWTRSSGGQRRTSRSGAPARPAAGRSGQWIFRQQRREPVQLLAGAAEQRLLGDGVLVVQVRVGFTWEHDAHLYYKNAISQEALFGGPGEQLDRLAALI